MWREKSVEYMAICMYNVLPTNIRKILCNKKFEKSLYELVWKTESYSLDKFKEVWKKYIVFVDLIYWILFVSSLFIRDNMNWLIRLLNCIVEL